MVENSKPKSHNFLKDFTNKVLNYLYQLRAWMIVVHNMEIVFDDAMLIDSNILLDYIQLKLQQFFYRFMKILLAILYMISEDSPSLMKKIVLIATISYLTWKAEVIVKKFEQYRTKYIIIFDMLIFSLYYLLYHKFNPEELLICQLCSFIFWFSISNDFFINICFAILGSCIDGVVFGTNEGGYFNLRIMLLALFFLYFTACTIYIFRLMISEFFRKTIQDRKRAEDEMHNYQLFISSITHDLKNPLGAILGCMDELQTSGSLTSVELEQVNIAATSGQIMLYLISDILDIGKINAGKFEINRVSMELPKEIRKITRIQAEIARQKGVRLYVQPLNRLPTIVYADPMRFSQMLINLIGNSVKFTSKGYVAVTAYWIRSWEELQAGLVEKILGIEDCPVPPESLFADFKDFDSERRKVEFYNSEASAKIEDGIGNAKEEEIEEGVDLSLEFKLSTHIIPEKKIPRTARNKWISTSNISKAREELSKTPIFSHTEANQEPLLTLFNNKTKSYSKKVNNLKKNSRRLIEKKSRRINIATEMKVEEPMSELEEVGNEGLLTINIIDTGIGMTQKEISRLFHPYTQANSDVKRSFGGTGLGLWITKEIIELMQGKISVTSRSGIGSNFQLTIPLKVIHQEESCSEKSLFCPEYDQEEIKDSSEEIIRLRETHIYRNKFKGNLLRVLIVEQENSSENKLIKILQQYNQCNVKIYHSFFSRLEKTLSKLSEKLDIVIVIAGMPVEHTWKALKCLEEETKFRFGRPIPAILLTDIGMMHEFKTYDSEKQIPFPLSHKSLFDLTHKICFRNKKVSSTHIRMDCEIFKIPQIKIILADDDVCSNLTIRTMIEKEPKFHVVTFFNGLEPCKYYEEHINEISLILLDLEMPELSGVEATKRIRKFENEQELARSVPIVSVSGYEPKEIEKVCTLAGMDMILHKPLTRRKLMEIISHFVP